MAKRTKAERVEIAPNVFKTSETSFYINVNGVMKYCNKARLNKLLKKVGGDYELLVANYNSRSKSPTPTAKKTVEVEEVVPAEELQEDILHEEFPLV